LYFDLTGLPPQPTAIDAFLAQHLRTAKWISNVPEHYVLLRDPKDSKYLNLAIAAAAPYVVTTDLDLLELMKSVSAVGIDFRRRFPTIRAFASMRSTGRSTPRSRASSWCRPLFLRASRRDSRAHRP
jgi:hypothetical protein